MRSDYLDEVDKRYLWSIREALQYCNVSKLAELVHVDQIEAEEYIQNYKSKHSLMMDMIKAGKDTTEIQEELSSIEYGLLDKANLSGRIKR